MIRFTAFAILSTIALPLSAQVPRLEAAAACPMQVSDALAPDVECGWLVVPQHWDSADGQQMRLAFAVVRAESETPEPDPLMFLVGGPSSALDHLSGNLAREPWAGLRRNRDVIFVDQRGTGYSEPKLCRSLDAAFRSSAFLLTAEQVANERIARVAAACADSMKWMGTDPAAFNADAIARDVEALRRLLGYHQWNLYGVSYGGRVAQLLMRSVPETIRSVVLDAPAPVGIPRTTIRALNEALDAVFSQCAADPACGSAFPDLEADFDRLMQRLASDPVAVPHAAVPGLASGDFVVNRDLALAAMQRGLYGESLAPILPLIISEAARGNDNALVALQPFVDEPWGTALDLGVLMAAACYEEPAADPAVAARERALHPRAASPLWTSPRLPAVCDSLHTVRNVPARTPDRTAVEVDVPVIILGGGHDSSVAPSSFRELATTLDATLVFASGRGHGLANSTDCTGGIVSSFFREPSGPVDTACLADLSSIAFVTDVRPVRGMAQYRSQVVFGEGGLVPQLWLMLSFLVLGSTLVIWPAVWLWRRTRGAGVDRSPGERSTSGEGGAVLLAVITAVAGMLFVIGLVRAINETLSLNPGILAVGVRAETGLVFLLPWLLAMLTTALAAAAIVAWRHRSWGHWRRVHVSAVALAAVSLVAFIGYWGLF